MGIEIDKKQNKNRLKKKWEQYWKWNHRTTQRNQNQSLVQYNVWQIFSGNVQKRTDRQTQKKMNQGKGKNYQEEHFMQIERMLTEIPCFVALGKRWRKTWSQRMQVRSELELLYGRNKTTETLNRLHSVVDTGDDSLSFSCLQNFNVDADSWDPILYFLFTERPDAVTRKDWEQHASANSSTDLPTYCDL